MMEKECYNSAEIEVFVFSNIDVITTSSDDEPELPVVPAN